MGQCTPDVTSLVRHFVSSSRTEIAKVADAFAQGKADAANAFLRSIGSNRDVGLIANVFGTSAAGRNAFFSTVNASVGPAIKNSDALQVVFGALVTTAGGMVYAQAGAAAVAAAGAGPLLVVIGIILIVVGIAMVGVALNRIANSLLAFIKGQMSAATAR
ncbi:hypothetical protein [Propylenella binzhouense]|uniref:Uncharacterized protein n=1 Tax=Propylenella binzhouense TaxID=2555902 RepID=A0A964WVL2_9HYPH|nr:hypothetical protein [Propylenella binzhouense]MYZ50301.1 hypothetical protein [Propylenella binzhouense]